MVLISHPPPLHAPHSVANAFQQVERLRTNWFQTARDIADMGREDATALGVPLRLWRYVARSLGAATDGDDAARTSEASDDEAARSLADSSSTGCLDSSSSSSAGGGGLEQGTQQPDLQASTSADPVAAIMQRRAPPRRRSYARDHIKVTKRVGLPPYGLVVSGRHAVVAANIRGFELGAKLAGFGKDPKGWAVLSRAMDDPIHASTPRVPCHPPKDSEISPALREELAAFAAFSTGRFFGQRVEPISAATCRVDLQYVRQMLGWLHRRRGVPLEDLSLRSMFPNSEEASVSAAFDFTEFLINVRGGGGKE